MKTITTLEQLAEAINDQETFNWDLIWAACTVNGWTIKDDNDYDICYSDNEILELDNNGVAVVSPISPMCEILVKLGDDTEALREELFENEEEAKAWLKNLDLTGLADYAGGEICTVNDRTKKVLFSKTIPERYTDRALRFTYMTYDEAKEKATELLGDGDYIEESEADCATMPSPRELDSWSGTISALRIYNIWGDEVAIIGYWEN